MIPKNSASSPPRLMSSQAPENPKNTRRLISKSANTVTVALGITVVGVVTVTVATGVAMVIAMAVVGFRFRG